MHPRLVDELGPPVPFTWAWDRSGTGSRSGGPRPVSLRTAVAGTSSRFASWETARLWSRRIIAVKRSAGMSGGVSASDQRVGVGRVADDEHPDVVGGVRVERGALGPEDAAV